MFGNLISFLALGGANGLTRSLEDLAAIDDVASIGLEAPCIKRVYTVIGWKNEIIVVTNVALSNQTINAVNKGTGNDLLLIHSYFSKPKSEVTGVELLGEDERIPLTDTNFQYKFFVSSNSPGELDMVSFNPKSNLSIKGVNGAKARSVVYTEVEYHFVSRP